jgi:RNA polymerase sigma-70 factor (ECF subfamily)
MKVDEASVLKLLSRPETRRQAFTLLVKEYSEPLYWRIRHLVLTHEDTNDILQNTFLKAWTSLETFRGSSKVSTWLYRIAINESLDFLRKKKQQTEMSVDAGASLANQLLADPFFDGDALQVQFQEAISQLPEVQRIVFNLRYFEELKYSEISKLLNTSEGALKASYHLAVRKITDYFNHHD